MLKEHTLFRVTTHRCGEFYVVAQSCSWDAAAAILTKALDESDYGYVADREITQIEIISKEHFFNDKILLCDDSRLVIDKSCF